MLSSVPPFTFDVSTGEPPSDEENLANAFAVGDQGFELDLQEQQEVMKWLSEGNFTITDPDNNTGEQLYLPKEVLSVSPSAAEAAAFDCERSGTGKEDRGARQQQQHYASTRSSAASSLARDFRRHYSTTSSIYAEQTIINPDTEQVSKGRED